MKERNSGWAGRAICAIAFGLTFACASPAAASDVAELDCVVAGLSQADGQALISGIELGEAAGRGRAVQAAARAAAQVLADCARRFDWSPEESFVASNYLPAFLGQQRFRRELQGQELDLAALERDVREDAALLRAAAEMRPDPPELPAFMTRLGPPVMAWAERQSRQPQLLNALGGFVASTALVEGMRLRFARA
jgi:hypothetical protein